MSLVHHEVTDCWGLQDWRAQAGACQRGSLRSARRVQGRLQPRQRVVGQVQQGADIAQTALLSEQRSDIQDTLCNYNASVWSVPSVIRTQLHGSALSRIQSVRWAGKV